MSTPTPDISDVVVIGAGIVGAAIARDLAGTGLSVTLVEPATTSVTAPARPTPRSCTPASTPSPAPWNPGWSPAATTFSADYAEQTGIPVERTGALLVAWTDEEARRPASPEGQG